MLLATLLAVALQNDDSLTLPVGKPGTVRIENGLTDLATGAKATPASVAVASRGVRYVLVGETHHSRDHHQMQADIIEALLDDGRDVVVGFEMFARNRQDALAPWTLGMWDEATFIERSFWLKEWGFAFDLYRPIFEVIRSKRLPMVALNVPRSWVRAMSTGTGLNAEQKAQLPELYMNNREHRKVWNALMQGHSGQTTASMDNMYSAQVLWDEGMADSAIKYMSKRSSRKLVMVILAGSGHVMYDQGINWRIRRRTGERTLSVVGLSGEPTNVSRGIGDFVFLSPTPPKQ